MVKAIANKSLLQYIPLVVRVRVAERIHSIRRLPTQVAGCWNPTEQLVSFRPSCVFEEFALYV